MYGKVCLLDWQTDKMMGIYHHFYGLCFEEKKSGIDVIHLKHNGNGMINNVFPLLGPFMYKVVKSFAEQ